MIALITNRPEYRNDIAEEIRLFFGQEEIVFGADAAAERTVTATLETEGHSVLALAAMEGSEHRERMALPSADRLSVKRVEKRAMKVAVFRLLKRLHPVSTPWGSLTGIRPTKLFREMAAADGEESAAERFAALYDVSDGKTALAREICRVQKPIVESSGPHDIDVYVNIPFCRSKCLYCSFPSEILSGSDALPPYLETLFLDIDAGGVLVRERGYRLRCMYIGGGTPTVLSAGQLDALLGRLKTSYGSLGKEITVEAGRPDTIDAEKLAVLRTHGVQRISINPQSMNDDTLVRIGRAHDAEAVETAFCMALAAGFPVINMDLIAGLPSEDVPDFLRTLERIRALAPENLTVHTLAIKRSSRLIDRLNDYPLPDAGAVEEMLALGRSAARDMGLLPYYLYRQKYMSGNLENVGFARPDAICWYNIDMMEETTSILAHGASAMSKRVFFQDNRVERIPNPKDIKTYREKLPALLLQKNALF